MRVFGVVVLSGELPGGFEKSAYHSMLIPGSNSDAMARSCERGRNSSVPNQIARIRPETSV